MAGLLVSGCERSSTPAPPAQAEVGKRPNVLLVVLDTTRRDRLGCYGYDRATSPNLDRLAATGTVFDNAISPGSWTLPAHASLFTGLFPRDHHCTIEYMRLDPHFPTLADVLGGAAYRTVGFSCNPWVGPRSQLQRGFAEFHEIWREVKQDDRDVHGAAMATERALGWIDARADDAPFFLFINYLEPHLPYSPPQPFRERFLPQDAEPRMVDELAGWKTPREFGYMLKVPGMEVTDEQFEILDALYDGDVAYMDSRLGELIDGLEQRGLLDETIVAVVADHGEMLGEHEMMDHKMTLYAENVRVPLVLRYPPAVRAGVRIEAYVQTQDLFPTILGLAGVPADTPWGSAPLPLQDGTTQGRAYTFVEFGRPSLFMEIMQKEWPGSDVRVFDRTLRAIRGRRFKYIWASDGHHELYDLADDPAEERNIAAARPEAVRVLQRMLTEFHSGRQRMIWAGDEEMDEERREALRSLGYIH